MRRTILTSLLLIGAALAVVFGGGAFSAFNDTEDISGSATAGVVGIRLSSNDANGDTADDEETSPDTLDLTFDASDCTNAVFAPSGPSCTIQVTVNRGELSGSPFTDQLAAFLKFEGFSINNESQTDPAPTGGSGSDTEGCWNVTIGGFVDADNNPTGNGYMPAGTDDTETFDITVSMPEDAPNTCQGDSLDIALTVLADQDTANPHNTADNPTP